MAKSSSITYRELLNRRKPQDRDEGLTSKRLPPPPPVRPANVQRAASQQAIQQRSQSYQRWLQNLQKKYPPSRYDIVLGGKGGWNTVIYEKPLPEGGGGGSGGSGSGSGEEAPKEITWREAYSYEGAPSWWKGMMPSEWNPETEFAAIVNALIPFLTPEDQRQMGSYLARLFPKGFSYNPESVEYTPPPPSVETGDRQKYLSSQRAEEALKVLDEVKRLSGKKDEELGPGYSYIRQIVKAFKDFGGTPEGIQTRRQVLNLYSTVDPLLAESRGEKLGAYGEIARAIVQPFMASGTLVNVSKDEQGNWVFGKGNKKWY